MEDLKRRLNLIRKEEANSRRKTIFLEETEMFVKFYPWRHLNNKEKKDKIYEYINVNKLNINTNSFSSDKKYSFKGIHYISNPGIITNIDKIDVVS